MNRNCHRVFNIPQERFRLVILHWPIAFFQRIRFLQAFHLAVTTIVQNPARYCEEGDTTRFPQSFTTITPGSSRSPSVRASSFFARPTFIHGDFLAWAIRSSPA
jgi:hypothetical protein